MPDDRYCDAPWNNISISNFGTIKPCPLFDTKLSVKPKFDGSTRNIELDNISDGRRYKESTVKPNESFVDWYDRQYEDVKTHNSVDHPGCRTCARAEKEGIKSRRQMQLNLNAGGDYINYIDISFGNVCNLKCLMCNSHNSTKWIKEEQHLREHGFYIDNIHGKREMHPKMLLQLIDYCNNIECDSFTINVKGGEPFVTAEFLSFVSKLSVQFKQKTKIKVFTNAAVVPTEYLDELSKFSQAILSISLEAVDDGLYRYIRGDTYGFDRIQSLMDRISIYPNMNIACSFTVSNYNIFHLDECARVLTDMGLLHISDTLCNIVENKKYLSPRYLPKHIKLQLIDKYSNNKMLEPIVNYLNNTVDSCSSISSNIQMAQFKKYTALLDEYRGDDLYLVVPEYKNILSDISL